MRHAPTSFVRSCVAAALVVLPASSFAHNGHAESFSTAFAHPFGGWDHLLTALIVGVWGARLAAGKGYSGLAAPVAFVGGAALGMLVGAAVPVGLAAEPGIVASLIVIGAMLAFALRVPALWAAAMCSVAGAFHGLAHGTELATASFAPMAGMLSATALLHALGLLSMRLAATRALLFARLLGIGAGVSGLLLAAQLA